MESHVFIAALCTLLLITQANASCLNLRMKCTPGPYSGEIPVPLSKCYECTCLDRGDGLSCCLNLMNPVGYNRKKCSKVLDEENCTYKVTRKNNSRKSCPVSAWTG